MMLGISRVAEKISRDDKTKTDTSQLRFQWFQEQVEMSMKVRNTFFCNNFPLFTRKKGGILSRIVFVAMFALYNS